VRHGIARLGPGGYAAFRGGQPLKTIPSTPWLPSFGPTTAASTLELLADYAESARNHRSMLSLGLSGGLDSRVLLAHYTRNPDCNIVTHTFGNAGDPDVLIAKQITATLGIQHRYLNDPLPEPLACISGISSYVAQTLVTEPCSSYLKLRYYPTLREDGRILVDGGFGEIARRQYFNRVVRFGRRAVFRRDAPPPSPHAFAQGRDLFARTHGVA